MMPAQEHYQKAVDLIEAAHQHAESFPVNVDATTGRVGPPFRPIEITWQIQHHLAEAQIHATLAAGLLSRTHW